MKRIIQLILIVMVQLSFAQSGTFLYEMQKKLKDSSFANVDFVLDVDNGESVFRTPHDKASDSLVSSNKFGYGYNTNLEGQIYVVKNTEEHHTYKSIKVSPDSFYEVAINETLDWKILPEVTRIDDFQVQKAEVSYGGRQWTAWFAPNIPLQEGPYVFYGLPGLIVEIGDKTGDYRFTLSAIRKYGGSLYTRKKGLEMDYPKFRKLMFNYYTDPYAENKATNTPIYKVNEDGQYVKGDYREMTKAIQKSIRDNNNPIEIRYKNNYK